MKEAAWNERNDTHRARVTLIALGRGVLGPNASHMAAAATRADSLVAIKPNPRTSMKVPSHHVWVRHTSPMMPVGRACSP